MKAKVVAVIAAGLIGFAPHFISPAPGISQEFRFSLGYAASAAPAAAHDPRLVSEYDNAGCIPDLVDDNGVVIVDYGGSIGRQYNPVTIAQKALGCYYAYLRDHDGTEWKIFTDQINWLTTHAIPVGDGGATYEYHFPWNYGLKPGWRSGLAQGQAISALIRYYYYTQDDSVFPLIHKLKNYMLTPRSKGGLTDTSPEGGLWIEEFPSTPPSFVLNGFISATFGLYEYTKLFPDDKAAVEAFNQAISSIKTSLPKYDAGNWMYLDRRSRPYPKASGGYAMGYVYQTRTLWQITGDPLFLATSLRWQSFFDGVNFYRYGDMTAEPDGTYDLKPQLWPAIIRDGLQNNYQIIEASPSLANFGVPQLFEGDKTTDPQQYYAAQNPGPAILHFSLDEPVEANALTITLYNVELYPEDLTLMIKSADGDQLEEVPYRRGDERNHFTYYFDKRSVKELYIKATRFHGQDRMVIAGIALGKATPQEALPTYGSFVTKTVSVGPGKFGVQIDAPRESQGEAFVIYRHAATAAKIESAPWVWDSLNPLSDDHRPVQDKFYQFDILTTASAAARGWREPRLVVDGGSGPSTQTLSVDEEPAPPKPAAPGITDKAFAGEAVTVRFDDSACGRVNLGSIKCGADYGASYDPAANRWTVSGMSRGNKEERTVASDNADKKPGQISVWGLIAHFDNDGALYYGKQKVGRVTLGALEKPPVVAAPPPVPGLTDKAFAGEAVTVRFDERACGRVNLGSIKCGADYAATYDPAANRWTVSGTSRTDKEETTVASDNADKRTGQISVWGLIARFDNDGTLYYGKQKVGRVTLGAPEKPPAVATAPPVPGLTDKAFAGEAVTARFDESACGRVNLGSIKCGADYGATYDPAANRWTVSGMSRTDREETTVASDNADKKPGQISVWGLIARFDNDGALYYGKQKVGRVTLGAPEKPAAASATPAAPEVPGLVDKAFSGEAVTVRFDPEACGMVNLGTMQCGSDYAAKYDPAANRWTVTGYNLGDKAEATVASANADKKPGQISIWGLLAHFDNDGALYYGGQKVGRVTLGAPEKRAVVAAAPSAPPASPASGPMENAFAGEPVTVRFDPDACGKVNLGTLKCGVDYAAKYDAATNRWTVTGMGLGAEAETTVASDNADKKPGQISVWGLIARFDNDGALYYGGQKVGRVTLGAPEKPAVVATTPPAPPTPGPMEKAFAGEPVIVRFDPDACGKVDLGTVKCGTDYAASYDPATNRWTVTGVSRSDDAETTVASDNAEKEPGQISVWGLIARFDNGGVLYYLGQKVGRVTLGAPEKRVPAFSAPGPVEKAFAGEPVTVRFDPDACGKVDLGTVKCGVDYAARYDPAINRWTVSGISKTDDAETTVASDNAEKKPGQISVWGLLARFDNDGALYYGGQKVGRVTLK